MTRFSLGQIFECGFDTGTRRAEVIELLREGRGAKLRFLDSGGTFEGDVTALVHFGRWRLVRLDAA